MIKEAAEATDILCSEHELSALARAFRSTIAARGSAIKKIIKEDKKDFKKRISVKGPLNQVHPTPVLRSASRPSQ